MIVKPIESITEADLQALIASRTPENRQLEYKQQLPDPGNGGSVKFLREITAFANTQGGDLIYGIAEDNGIADALNALHMPSQDLIRQRFENLCADGVEPRLTGLVQYHFVPLAAGGEVLVVRVRKSWNAPHRVTTGNHAHFYGRNASGAYQLDVGELRQAFTLSETIAERIRAFRADRLLKLGSGEPPVPLVTGARVILHLVPLQSMTSETKIEMAPNSQRLRSVRPPGASGWSYRLNLDGAMTYTDTGHGNASGYMLFLRAGVIEAVQVWDDFNGERVFPSLAYESDILEAMQTYFPLLLGMGIGCPAYVFLTLTGVSDYQFAVDRSRFIGAYHRTDRDSLVLPEIQVENWPVDPAEMMRPLFDMVWNAFGYERSFNYDQSGRWNPRS